MAVESLFWADQLAKEITGRKRFRYNEKKITKPKKFVVKTSASVSGVLHIGRLSDTIRGESVFRALRDAGKKAELIWVAEDMDPLRKVPEGVPKEYGEFIGKPVTDIPDHLGCHESYAQHHTERYFEVLDMFVSAGMKKYSMREEYRKGAFRPFIKKLMDSLETVVSIQNKYRTTPLKPGWSPWSPICGNCGKIITPRITGFEDGKIAYECRDYGFEKTTAKGCGHAGVADPVRDDGKLLWKSEWASQWARWGVVSEGAGKEYQVPMSAFWVNAEICERVFGFPSPVPIFYEHLMIDGKKMSASLGNVVYPHEWLEVATPELLRYFYNKRLMKTRSFSWRDLPTLFNEYDRAADIYFGRKKMGNKKEEDHIRRLFEISQLKRPKDAYRLPYDFASVIVQTAGTDIGRSESILKSTGHISSIKAADREELISRLGFAKKWVDKYLEKSQKIMLIENVSKGILNKLSNSQSASLRSIAEELVKRELTEEEIHSIFFETAR